MTKNNISCCILLLLFLCASLACGQPIYNIEGIRRDFNIKINPSLPEFTFSFFYQFDSLNKAIGISRVEIRRADKLRILQTINLRVINQSYEPYSFYQFLLEDINFDRYLDILLSLGQQGTGGSFFEVWVYDRKLGKFKKDPQFTEIANPEPHPETKTITSTSQAGIELNYEDTFGYEHGKLILLREVVNKYNERIKLFLRTTTVYKHKKAFSVTVDTLKD